MAKDTINEAGFKSLIYIFRPFLCFKNTSKSKFIYSLFSSDSITVSLESPK